MDRKVNDYSTFSSNKKKNKNFNTDMEFTAEVRYIDLDIHNRPTELTNVSSIECEIDYKARILTGESGIDAIEFAVSTIELEFMVDNHPHKNKEIEIDIIAGKNISQESIVPISGDIPVPSAPTRVEVDMAKSMNPKDFKITVFFGQDR